MELQINNLNKKYSNGVHALNDVSLTIKKGMFGYGNNFPYSNSSSIKQVNRSKTCKLDLKTNNILIKTNKTGNDEV